MMQLGRLDHVNIRTANLDKMVDWYTSVLRMTVGARPPFPFPGAWLYVENEPWVHLNGAEDQFDINAPQLEHFAFRATGAKSFVTHLDEIGENYRLARVVGNRILQVHLSDFDGNHIHIDFTPEEADQAGF